MTIIREKQSRIIVIYLKIWPKLARACNLSTVQNQLLRLWIVVWSEISRFSIQKFQERNRQKLKQKFFLEMTQALIFLKIDGLFYAAKLSGIILC